MIYPNPHMRAFLRSCADGYAQPIRQDRRGFQEADLDWARNALADIAANLAAESNTPKARALQALSADLRLQVLFNERRRRCASS